jgi:hypothetical protein
MRHGTRQLCGQRARHGAKRPPLAQFCAAPWPTFEPPLTTSRAAAANPVPGSWRPAMRRVVSLWLPHWPADRIRRRYGEPSRDEPLVTAATTGAPHDRRYVPGRWGTGLVAWNAGRASLGTRAEPPHLRGHTRGRNGAARAGALGDRLFARGRPRPARRHLDRHRGGRPRRTRTGWIALGRGKAYVLA